MAKTHGTGSAAMPHLYSTSQIRVGRSWSKAIRHRFPHGSGAGQEKSNEAEIRPKCADCKRIPNICINQFFSFVVFANGISSGCL